MQKTTLPMTTMLPALQFTATTLSIGVPTLRPDHWLILSGQVLVDNAKSIDRVAVDRLRRKANRSSSDIQCVST